MKSTLTTIGRAERMSFPILGLSNVPARIDTGAKTSSLWASDVRVRHDALRFVLFDISSKHFNGHEIETSSFEKRIIASSNGMTEERYVVKLTIILDGRKIKASFSLANRSSQAYPVLIGRNILRGKFLVDVKQGRPLVKAEKRRSKHLQSKIHSSEEQS